MKPEYDFSEAAQGKFFQPNAVFNFPVHLDPDVNAYLTQLAEKKDVDVQKLVNDWLRANIKLVESVHKAI